MALQRTKIGNWADSLKQLGKTPEEIIPRLADASQLMKDRISRYRADKTDREHFTSGACIGESFNCIGKKIYAARAEFNPLIHYAQQAVESRSSINEFYLTDNVTLKYKGKDISASKLLLEIADEDSKKPLGNKRVVDLGDVVTHNVPTDSFADDKTIAWLARGERLARQYGLFLKNDLDFEQVIVYHMSLNERDYSRSVWITRLDGDGGSNFLCNFRSLNYGDGFVFGVVRTGEASAQKFSKEKVRISQPSLQDVLKYSRGYVGPNAWTQFKEDITTLFERK